MIPVYIFASDKYLWALRVTLHLYEKYWNWPVTVFGFSLPTYPLPACAQFKSMGKFEEYPAWRWSDAVIGALQSTGDEIAVVMLEDYWLTRRVNLRVVRALGDYMKIMDITRADLVTDRLYADNLKDLPPYGELDIITNDPPGQYAMSLQASIWNVDRLIKIMRPGETAWQTELEGTTRMTEAGYKVIGTRQCPVRYIIGVQNGKLALDGGYQKPGPVWQPDDLETVKQMLAEDGVL